MQSRAVRAPETIFCDYAYFSSYSKTWLEHCERYVEQMTERYGIGRDSQVVEIASNDGYLLQYFAERGVPVLGIEPAANVAKVGEPEGHPDARRVLRREARRGRWASRRRPTC